MNSLSLTFIRRHHRILFFSCWLLLGLIQSGLTELQDDEAYYWVYSQHLSWGYFDHPPMIALLVKMGYSLFHSELGIRLFPLLLNLGSLLIMERLTEKKNPLVFYTIALSIGVLQIAGFTAAPDIPLIFFTALFFLCYRNFYRNSSLANTVWLGIATALLFYSKYHAVLIVLFTLLSDLKLFKKYQVYIAGLLALVLFVPHLWWQYQHDWVSFKYHLFESNVNAYKLSHTTDYILGQLLLPGPIAGFILLPAAFKYKCTNPTERAMRFTMLGIYIFFLLSSFRGKVEANWTSPVIVPLVVLSHQYLTAHWKWQQLLMRLLPLSLLIVVFARVAMIRDFVPLKYIREHYHSWQGWPSIVREKTKGIPVVFTNSYQRASKYWFYTGQPTYSMNFYRERRNNYNFWPLEDSLLGKPTYILDVYNNYKYEDSLRTPLGWVCWRYDSCFVSFAKVMIRPDKRTFSIAAGDSIQIPFHTEAPDKYREFVQTHTNLNDTVRIGIFNDKGWQKDVLTNLSVRSLLSTPSLAVNVKPGLPAGKYFMRFAINAGKNAPTHNSEKIDLTIKK